MAPTSSALVYAWERRRERDRGGNGIRSETSICTGPRESRGSSAFSVRKGNVDGGCVTDRRSGRHCEPALRRGLHRPLCSPAARRLCRCCKKEARRQGGSESTRFEADRGHAHHRCVGETEMDERLRRRGTHQPFQRECATPDAAKGEGGMSGLSTEERDGSWRQHLERSRPATTQVSSGTDLGERRDRGPPLALFPRRRRRRRLRLTHSLARIVWMDKKERTTGAAGQQTAPWDNESELKVQPTSTYCQRTKGPSATRPPCRMARSPDADFRLGRA